MCVCVCVCVYLQCPAFDDNDVCRCCLDAIDNCLKTDDEGILKQIQRNRTTLCSEIRFLNMLP